MYKNKVNTIAILISMLITVSFSSGIAAEDRFTISKWIEKMNVKGDIRLRQESIWKNSPGQRDRSRQRFRFRLSITPQVDNFVIGFRIASGVGEQTSTNQSFDSLSSEKGLFIDRAYIQWNAFKWLKLTGGKMPNPFWRVYSSDLMWDSDVNPEGFTEAVIWEPNNHITAFITLSQIVLDEDSGDTRDQWMLGYQAGVKTKINDNLGANLSAQAYDLMNETVSTFGQVKVNEGNSRRAGSNTLASSFTIVGVTAEVTTKIADLPISLQGDYVKNTQSQLVAPNDDMGYQIGARINKVKKAKSWEAAYFFKYLETDAVVADIADADFGDGGTNRKGHIVWIAYAPKDYMKISLKAFFTKTLNPALAPGPDNIDKAQLDVVIKF